MSRLDRERLLKEYQRLELLRLLQRLTVESGGSREWWKDLPTLAGRLVESGQVSVLPQTVSMDTLVRER